MVKIMVQTIPEKEYDQYGNKLPDQVHVFETDLIRYGGSKHGTIGKISWVVVDKLNAKEEEYHITRDMLMRKSKDFYSSFIGTVTRMEITDD